MDGWAGKYDPEPGMGGRFSNELGKVSASSSSVVEL